MANIKISELNELETRHRNDLLPIVDSVNNETKKIKVEDLINENVELIAVSSTAPSECSLGDKYFNTTSNKIYTAIATNTWSSTGENAVEGILYVVFGDQSTYAYNGTTLVSVGGGSGGTITQQSTAPENPEENDLWIDTLNGNSLKRYNGTTWELVSTNSDEPIGTILPFAGTTPPSDYLLCTGQAVSRTTYADLFNVIGTTYGSGDGNTTFNLPDLGGRVPVGLHYGETEFLNLGQKGGEKTHTLTIAEIPSHRHQLPIIPVNNARSEQPYASDGHMLVQKSAFDRYSDYEGGGQAHNNLQPYLVVHYIIKATKTTPVQAHIVDGYSTSTTDGYSCNEANTLFQTKGQVLWTNPNPTSGFDSQTIILSTSNWDYCEIIYKNYMDSDTFESQRIYKDYIPSELGGTFYYNNFLYTGTRKITSQQNGLILGFGYAQGIKLGDTVLAADIKLIVPIKIIGYKN